VGASEPDHRYASPEGLGQAFNFDLLMAPWDPGALRTVIGANLTLAQSSGASSTWVLSNHDVVRHASRYGLPSPRPDDLEIVTNRVIKDWLLTDGNEPKLDPKLGLRRARAATLLMLALPGSAYLYQGEELGLHEVADLPAAVLQDPSFFRTHGAEKGRDGCRVPLPWTRSGPSCGFGSGGAHLPQPEWFSQVSVEAQETDPDSTLSLYRNALAARRRLQASEELEWVDAGTDVLHFVRPNGWHCVTNLGPDPVPLPDGELVVSSTTPVDGLLPGDATAWVTTPVGAG